MTIYVLKEVQNLKLGDILLLNTEHPFAHGKITFVQKDQDIVDIEYSYGLGLENFDPANTFTCYYDSLEDKVLVLEKA